MRKTPTSADAEVHQPRKKAEASVNKPENYFKPRATGDSPRDEQALYIPDVATDVGSTYFRFHTKLDSQEEDKEFPHRQKRSV